VQIYICFYHGVTALVGQGHIIIEDSWSHSDSPQSVGLLWTSYQLEAETSTRQHTTFTRDRRPIPRWVSNPQSQQASGRRHTTLDSAATEIGWCIM